MDKAIELYQTARQYIAGGVSSSTRVNKALERPFFISRGDGGLVYDLEGKSYVDLCTSHGASLLGHNHPKIKEAVQRVLDMGIICSYENEYHSKLAQKLVDIIPCADLVRFVGSGTESTMYALKIARGYTGKEKFIRFEGHFHGYHDYASWSYAPPVDQEPVDGELKPYCQSDGIPKGIGQYPIVVQFGDLAALEKVIKRHKDEVAAVICEPIHYNCGCIIPDREYMKAMRELTAANGIVLIYDEVLSAFRMGPGGAQEYLGVTPDLCTIGKCVGGGLPLSVIAGKREVMSVLRPTGNTEHSGTYNGHIMNVAAGLAAVTEISSPGFYERIYAIANRFYPAFEGIIERSGVKARIQYLGARFGIYFGIDTPVCSYRDAVKSNKDAMLKFIAEANRRGVYFHDYGGKAAHHGFSVAHTDADIDRALEGIEGALKTLK